MSHSSGFVYHRSLLSLFRHLHRVSRSQSRYSLPAIFLLEYSYFGVVSPRVSRMVMEDFQPISVWHIVDDSSQQIAIFLGYPLSFSVFPVEHSPVDSTNPT